MRSLLDVNVLVALFDPGHLNHDAAHKWFARNRAKGWATCPLTESGFVRVVTNPAYRGIEATPHEAAARLRELCAADEHSFWALDFSVLDTSKLRLTQLQGHQGLTDAYLLALAVQNDGVLVTFDRRIPVKAAMGNAAAHLEVIG